SGGKGGDGGKGGFGGDGSGGTGGPSAGVFRGGGTSFYSERATTQTGGKGGTGGRVGGHGLPSPNGPSSGLLQAGGVGSAAGDFDADGVTDPLDDCPTVAAVATTNGCPVRPAKLIDTDHDGIPDTDGRGTAIDKCPTVAPAPGTDADGDGCPDPVVTPPPTATATATPVPQPGSNTPPPSTGSGGGPAPAAVEQVVVTVSYFAKAGAKSSKFTSLKVRNVPLGATVTVTCKGSGCPRGLKRKGYTKKNAFGSVNLKTFIKKPLKVGVTITVVVSKPNAISAVKILKVRKSKAPTITTRCIRPGSKKQVACA
ncbi:MAG TPA: hypothetical protein VNS09_14480, partial [Solirubrobacter sp.]|nr:hypothetical protein [Solirubrobacter sp.]